MEFFVEERDDGKLLREYLRERGVSSALLAKLKRHERGILLDGVRVTVRAVLHTGSVLTLAVEDEEEGSVVARDLPIDVLLRTADFAVLNKCADMPTHPSHGHFEDTLANALAYHFAKDGVPFRPRFINRLDRNTTGAVLVAMHPLAAATLSRAMANGEIEKSYLALAHGEMTEPRVIKTGIRRQGESIILREVCDIHEGDYAEIMSILKQKGVSDVGESETVQMQIPFSAEISISDKLGILSLKDFIVEAKSRNSFVCEFHNVDLFLGRLFTLDADVRIVAPEWLREKAVECASRITKNNK